MDHTPPPPLPPDLLAEFERAVYYAALALGAAGLSHLPDETEALVAAVVADARVHEEPVREAVARAVIEGMVLGVELSMAIKRAE